MKLTKLFYVILIKLFLRSRWWTKIITYTWEQQDHHYAPEKVKIYKKGQSLYRAEKKKLFITMQI